MLGNFPDHSIQARFVGTNAMDEPITSCLLVIRAQSIPAYAKLKVLADSTRMREQLGRRSTPGRAMVGDRFHLGALEVHVEVGGDEPGRVPYGLVRGTHEKVQQRLGMFGRDPHTC